MAEGWFDGAIKRPGPAWKVGYAVFGRTSKKDSVVDHSSEGPLAATLGVLDSWRTASWQFTNDDSALYQHYPISDVCWHAGFEANKRCVGVENTGRKSEPLTGAQYNHLVQLHLWLKEQGVLTVCERRVDLWEHNEWMATDCPSGRIPWDRLIADLKEEEVPGIDWPKEKLKLLNSFLEWWDVFPETQEAKDYLEKDRELTGSNVEERSYRRFYEQQIAWRSPPR